MATKAEIALAKSKANVIARKLLEDGMSVQVRPVRYLEANQAESYPTSLPEMWKPEFASPVDGEDEADAFGIYFFEDGYWYWYDDVEVK